jgi:hypothetical protein
VDGFIPVGDEGEFCDFPAGAGQGSVKIRTMLTSVAKSQERVVAKPPSTKFNTFRTVRINPHFLSIKLTPNDCNVFLGWSTLKLAVKLSGKLSLRGFGGTWN